MSLSKNKGLSLAELILTLTISSILLIAAFPLLIKLPKGDDSDSIACIKGELANNLSSSYCFQAIKNCKYKQNNACKTITFLANHGKSEEQTAARKVLQEICNQDGEDACKYFLEDCQKNGDNCNITGSDYDLNYYLNLPTSNSTAGRIRIEELGKSFYNIGYPNIVSEIDNTCCNPDFNTACVASGTVSCPWQLSTQLGSVEIPEGMAMDPDGNMYLSGYGNNWALSNYDALITKISPSGTILWMKRVGHSNTTLDELGKKITVDHTGDIYVVGSTDTAGVDDMFVIKMNTNGNVIWQRKIASTYNNDDIGYDVAVDNDKNVYIAGMTHNGSYSNLAILKLNSGGNVEWGKAIGVAGQYADALGITVDTNGDIYAIGRYYTNATNNMDIALIKLNSSGTLLMQKVINSGSNSYDLGTDVKVKNNNIYIAARSVFYGWDFTAIKLDSSGNVTWARRINESTLSSPDYTNGMGVDNNENVYITGEGNNGTDDAMAIIKFNSQGTKLWDKRLDYSTAGSSDIGYNIIPDNKGSVYIGGRKTRPDTDQMMLKIKANQTNDNVYSDIYTEFYSINMNFTTADPGFYVESTPYTYENTPGYTTANPGYTGIN